MLLRLIDLVYVCFVVWFGFGCLVLCWWFAFSCLFCEFVCLGLGYLCYLGVYACLNGLGFGFCGWNGGLCL